MHLKNLSDIKKQNKTAITKRELKEKKKKKEEKKKRKTGTARTRGLLRDGPYRFH